MPGVPDGTLIAFAYDTGSGKCNRLGVINRLDGKILFEELLPDNDIRCLAWHPDGRTIAIGFWRWAQRDEAVAIWDVSKGTVTKHLAALDSVESLAWTPKGDRLAAAHPNQDITLWSSKTWRQLAKLNRHPGQSLPVAGGDHMLAWNKDGNILIAGTGRGWVIQWNTATGREIGSFKSHQERVRSIAISPNESRLATASSDGTIKVWDSVTGDLLMTLRGHKTRLRSIEWSPDGKRILSVDTNELRLWDASAGYRLASSPTREARR